MLRERTEAAALKESFERKAQAEEEAIRRKSEEEAAALKRKTDAEIEALQCRVKADNRIKEQETYAKVLIAETQKRKEDRLGGKREKRSKRGNAKKKARFTKYAKVPTPSTVRIPQVSDPTPAPVAPVSPALPPVPATPIRATPPPPRKQKSPDSTETEIEEHIRSYTFNPPPLPQATEPASAPPLAPVPVPAPASVPTAIVTDVPATPAEGVKPDSEPAEEHNSEDEDEPGDSESASEYEPSDSSEGASPRKRRCTGPKFIDGDAFTRRVPTTDELKLLMNYVIHLTACTLAPEENGFIAYCPNTVTCRNAVLSQYYEPGVWLHLLSVVKHLAPGLQKALDVEKFFINRAHSYSFRQRGNDVREAYIEYVKAQANDAKVLMWLREIRAVYPAYNY